MNPDGTSQQRLTSNDGGTTASGAPTWAPDGSQIAFWTNRTGSDQIWVMNADGSNQHALTDGPCDLSPDWSPSGDRIAFQSCRDGDEDIYVVSTDGSGETRLTDNTASDSSPAWSPDGQRIAFSGGRDGNRDIYTMRFDGIGESRVTTHPASDNTPAYAPDNNRILFTTVRSGARRLVYYVRPDGTNEAEYHPTSSAADSAPDWGAVLPRRHVRPKSASPVQWPLVPAYAGCTEPNREHGPPLGFPSCAPPTQASDFLTVGTSDANGAAVASVGSFRLKVFNGTPGPPHDSQIRASLTVTDVRCASGAQPCGSTNAQAGADYVGELEVHVPLRVTDTFNSVNPDGFGTDHATMTDYTLRLGNQVSCVATASTVVGSTCSFSAEISSWVPGITPEGRRSVWEIGRVTVTDGGPDGEAATAGNELFATQGVFVP